MKKISLILFSLAIFISSVNAQDNSWSLKECIDYALQNNLSVKQSLLNNQFNKVDIDQSRATRVPVVSGSASHAYNFGRTIDPFTNQYVTSNIHSNNFSLNSSLILFNGFQNTNTIAQNVTDYQAGSMDAEAIKNNLTLSVMQYYYEILLAMEQVEISKVQIQTTTSNLERTEKLVKAGTVAEINLMQLKAQLASDKVNLANAENQIRIARLNLMQLLDLPVSTDFNIEVSEDLQKLPSGTFTSVDDVYNSAEQNQPVLKSARLKIQSSALGLKIAKGSKYPRLSVYGNLLTGYSSARTLNSIQTRVVQSPIGYLQNNPDQLVYSSVPVNTVVKNKYPWGNQVVDNFGQSVGLNLSVPILNTRQARSNIERAKINEQLSRINEQSAKNSLRKSIEQAYNDMLNARNTLDAAQESLSLLEQSYLNSEKKYNLGMLSTSDFVIERNNFYNAQAQLTRAKYQYALTSRVLEFYKNNQVVY